MRPPEFWNHRIGREAAPVTRALLTPFSWLYSATGALRQALAKPYKSKARIICIGNLTLGGAGKTPVTIAVLNRLRAKGLKAAALTRGYGGSLKGPLIIDESHTARNVGDEALLLARTAPTIVARDRAAGARLAEQEGFEIIVMDDGFQNPSLIKDLSIIVVDGETGFGNRCVFPAGPLREPIVRGLARAHALLTMQPSADTPRGSVQGAESWRGAVLNAWLEPAPEAQQFAGQPVVAFAGIGRPQKFVDTLQRLGADVANAIPYPDHHVYSASDLKDLQTLAKKEGAVLVTTEKDFVRLQQDQREGISFLPVHAVFAADLALDALLGRCCPIPCAN